MQNQISKVNPKVTEKVKAALPDDLTDFTSQEANSMAYKTMSPLIYYPVTVALYCVEVLLAILINNIGMVFGFIMTFAGTGLQFFIPSLFVIIGFKKFADYSFL